MVRWRAALLRGLAPNWTRSAMKSVDQRRTVLVVGRGGHVALDLEGLALDGPLTESVGASPESGEAEEVGGAVPVPVTCDLAVDGESESGPGSGSVGADLGGIGQTTGHDDDVHSVSLSALPTGVVSC